MWRQMQNVWGQGIVQRRVGVVVQGKRDVDWGRDCGGEAGDWRGRNKIDGQESLKDGEAEGKEIGKEKIGVSYIYIQIDR